MPRRFRKKKRGKKRTYARKKKSYASTSLFKQTPSAPLGDKFLFKTKYFEKNLLLNAPSAGLSANYVFSANGMYDTNITGTGHQPLGFDQLMTMFDHYTVIASKIRVEFVNTDATNTQICGIVLNDDNSPSTNPQVIIENGNGKYVTLMPANTTGCRKTMTLSCNPSKFLGLSKPMSNTSLRGTVASNPAEQVYYSIWSADNNQDDPGQIDISVFISFVAVLTEPVQLNSS